MAQSSHYVKNDHCGQQNKMKMMVMRKKMVKARLTSSTRRQRACGSRHRKTPHDVIYGIPVKWVQIPGTKLSRAVRSYCIDRQDKIYWASTSYVETIRLTRIKKRKEETVQVAVYRCMTTFLRWEECLAGPRCERRRRWISRVVDV
jgi:hypothetical protein